MMMSWKLKLRASLYQANQTRIQQLDGFMKEKAHKMQRIQHQASEILKHIIQNVGSTKEKVILQKQHPDYSHHNANSFYLPLKRSAQLRNQVQLSFPRISSSQYMKLTIYQEISKLFQTLKEQNSNIEDIWEKCLERYLSGLDLIRKIQVLLQILKESRPLFQPFATQFAPQCNLQVFKDEVLVCSKYLRSNINKIDNNSLQRIFKANYCSICLIYGCSYHNAKVPITRLWIKNQLQITQSFIDMAQQSNRTLRKSQSEFKYKQLCSQQCYKKLHNGIIHKLTAPRMTNLLLQLIELGIQMFGYSPCRISALLIFEKEYISCEETFIYLLEAKLLVYPIAKMYANQYQMLRDSDFFNPSFIAEMNRQRYLSTMQENYIIQPRKRQTNTIGISRQIRSFSEQICRHYSIDQNAKDINCGECICHFRGYCLAECLCESNCHLKKGCGCKKGQCNTEKCKCFIQDRQCQPGVCHNCYHFNKVLNINSCKNCQITLKKRSQIKIGSSGISDLRLSVYAKQKISAKSLISTYNGQIVHSQIKEMREHLQLKSSFYNQIQSGKYLCSRKLGNKMRFINQVKDHSQNVSMEKKQVKGQIIIAIYALKQINENQELTIRHCSYNDIQSDSSEKIM